MSNQSPRKAWLSLGSNMGASRKNLVEAIRLLEARDGIRVTRVSSYYVTKPWGYTVQDDFINIVVEVDTDLSATELLENCLAVEQELGRIRVIHWGPRIVDVDVLLYEGYQSETEVLTVPHARMWERGFVLVPLMEIASENKPLLQELVRLGQNINQLETTAENLGIQQGAIKDK